MPRKMLPLSRYAPQDWLLYGLQPCHGRGATHFQGIKNRQHGLSLNPTKPPSRRYMPRDQPNIVISTLFIFWPIATYYDEKDDRRGGKRRLCTTEAAAKWLNVFDLEMEDYREEDDRFAAWKCPSTLEALLNWKALTPKWGFPILSHWIPALRLPSICKNHSCSDSVGLFLPCWRWMSILKHWRNILKLWKLWLEAMNYRSSISPPSDTSDLSPYFSIAISSLYTTYIILPVCRYNSIPARQQAVERWNKSSIEVAGCKSYLWPLYERLKA